MWDFIWIFMGRFFCATERWWSIVGCTWLLLVTFVQIPVILESLVLISSHFSWFWLLLAMNHLPYPQGPRLFTRIYLEKSQNSPTVTLNTNLQEKSHTDNRGICILYARMYASFRTEWIKSVHVNTIYRNWLGLSPETGVLTEKNSNNQITIFTKGRD